jgi:hypothetical protein
MTDDGQPVIRCFLEIDSVPVDPSAPHYWWPTELYTGDAFEATDWAEWTDIGATTDAVPVAFRNRHRRV